MPLFQVLFQLVLFCLGAYIIWWLISQFSLPDPLNKVVLVIFVLVCLYVLFVMFGALTGLAPLRLR